MIIFNEDAAQDYYTQVKTKFAGGSVTTERTGATISTSEDQWFGLKANFTSYGYTLSVAVGTTGAWVVQAEGAWANTGTMGNLNILRLGSPNTSADSKIYFDDVLVYELETNTGKEITGITSINCSKSIYGSGGLLAVVHDEALANFATYKAYQWGQFEVWTNNLEKKIWEGYITDVTMRPRNHITLQGMETIRALENTFCEYSTLLAEGEVTTVGADYIDDINASFTADLVGKLCTFTDTVGPTIELDYPNSSSACKQADRATAITLTWEQGSYASLASTTGGGFGLTEWNTRADTNSDNYCMILEFTVANAASCEDFEFNVICDFAIWDEYTTKPSLYLYEKDGDVWEDMGDFEGNLIPFKFKHSDDCADADQTHYFDGTTIKIAIHAGVYASDHSTDEEINCCFAECKNTYSSVFAAKETVYTIDALDSNTLTFTGQTPDTDGVAAADRYKVGDLLHTNMGNIWSESNITVLSLDYETSTIPEASDTTTNYILDVLNNYARKEGRYYWQSIGYVVKSLSTIPTSGLTVYDKDILTLPNGDWDDGFYKFNCRKLFKGVKVSGDGVFAEGSQALSYPSPLGLLYTDSQIGTQRTAEKAVANLLTKHSTSDILIQIKINIDDGTNKYGGLDVGVSIDLTFTDGNWTDITAGFIQEIHYSQTRGSDLFAKLVVEG